jgi:hypothetical protein
VVCVYATTTRWGCIASKDRTLFDDDLDGVQELLDGWAAERLQQIVVAEVQAQSRRNPGIKCLPYGRFRRLARVVDVEVDRISKFGRHIIAEVT